MFVGIHHPKLLLPSQINVRLRRLLVIQTPLQCDCDDWRVAGGAVVVNPKPESVVTYYLVNRSIRFHVNVSTDNCLVIRSADSTDVINRDCLHYMGNVVSDLRGLLFREGVEITVVCFLHGFAEFGAHFRGSHTNTDTAILAVERLLNGRNMCVACCLLLPIHDCSCDHDKSNQRQDGEENISYLMNHVGSSYYGRS